MSAERCKLCGEMMNKPGHTYCPREHSFAPVSGLADLVAKYLASDGSHGLYDARTMIEVREKIVPAIISRERIVQEREKILSRIVG